MFEEERQTVMRLIPYIFLTLLATTALAQNNDFGFYPNFGPPEGGTEINILESANNFHRFNAPQVFFDDVASSRVTLVDAYNIKAVAPAHAIGAVSVIVRDNGALLHSFSQFIFRPQLEEIIIPIAFKPVDASFGTRWVSEISVYNDSDDAVPIDSELCYDFGTVVPCSEPPRRVQPHSSMSVEPFSAYASQPMMWLLPPADHADRLHFTVRLHETSRDPDGPGTEIPVIRSRDFQKTQVWLPSIPTSSRFRSTLRVLTNGYSVTVRVMDDTTGQLLSEQTVQRSFPTDGPSLGMVTFDNPLAAAVVGAHERVRIEADSQSPVWAMVTLTDNESQRVQIFTPR